MICCLGLQSLAARHCNTRTLALGTSVALVILLLRRPCWAAWLSGLEAAAAAACTDKARYLSVSHHCAHAAGYTAAWILC
jgi:uncharacterized membrane protein